MRDDCIVSLLPTLRVKVPREREQTGVRFALYLTLEELLTPLEKDRTEEMTEVLEIGSVLAERGGHTVLEVGLVAHVA